MKPVPGRKTKLPCPLCGSVLFTEDKLHSISYDAGKEKIMHITGCPHCRKPEPGIIRRCPVCRRELPLSGFVVGRMWERNGKLHLHITGCTECKPQYKTANMPPFRDRR